MVILNESKKIKNLELYKRNAIILASLLGITGMTQAAECYGVINSYTTASNGTACTVSGSNYDYIHAANPGTIITVTNPVSVVSSSSATAAVIASNGSSINFMGDTTVSAIGQRHGVYIVEGSNVIINGNLNSTPSGKNARAIHIDGQGASLIVNGDLTGTRIGNIGGAVVELTGGNSITVGGATHLIGNSTDGLRNAGTAVFSEDVIVDASNYTNGISNTGTLTANGSMNINATNMSAGGLVNGSGRVNVKKDLTITNNTTTAENTSGINISGGKVSVEGNTKVDVTGTATNNMSNAYAAGIRVTGVNSIFESLGTNNTITTTGMNAHGIYITNGTIALGRTGTAAEGITVLLESGNIKTTGSGASGIYALSPTSGDVTIDIGTATSIEATGSGSIFTDGVKAINNVGNILVTTAGEIYGYSKGIRAVISNDTSTGNIKIIQTDGNVKGGTEGISADNSGSGDTTIILNSGVTGGEYGILMGGDDGTLNVDIGTLGTVTGGRSGIVSSLFSSNKDKGININVSGTVVGGTGYGILTDTLAESSIIINLNNGANVSATSGIGIMDGEGAYSSYDMGKTTLTMNSGSKLSGKVILGNNSDAMIINGTSDINDVTLLDGGNRDGIVYGVANTGIMIDLLGSTTYTNKLTFNETTQSIA